VDHHKLGGLVGDRWMIAGELSVVAAKRLMARAGPTLLPRIIYFSSHTSEIAAYKAAGIVYKLKSQIKQSVLKTHTLT